MSIRKQVPPQLKPPSNTQNLPTPLAFRDELCDMNRIFYIAGVSIIAKTLEEAYAYFREMCDGEKG
jgi:hypothetical protein